MNYDNHGFAVIMADLLMDGSGGPPVEKSAVILKGSKIWWVGKEKDLPQLQGAIPVAHRFPDCTILPGLVDVHTHTNLPGDGTAVEEGSDEPDEMLVLRSAWNARKHLETGVTTWIHPRAPNGHQRASYHHYRRPLLAYGGRGRRDRWCEAGSAAVGEGGRGLHQGDDYRRRY